MDTQTYAAPSKPQPIPPGTPTLFQRVFTKVIVNHVTGCWEWTGAYSHKRRGQRPVIQLGRRGSRVVIVARLVCTWVHGVSADPHDEAGHTCPCGENPRCINPDHVQWQSRIENEHSKQRSA